MHLVERKLLPQGTGYRHLRVYVRRSHRNVMTFCTDMYMMTNYRHMDFGPIWTATL